MIMCMHHGTVHEHGTQVEQRDYTCNIKCITTVDTEPTATADRSPSRSPALADHEFEAAQYES